MIQGGYDNMYVGESYAASYTFSRVKTRAVYEEDVSEETHQHTYLRQTIDQAVFSNDHDRMMVRKRRCSDVDSSLVDIHTYTTMNVFGIDAQYHHGEVVRLAVKPAGGIGRW